MPRQTGAASIKQAELAWRVVGAGNDAVVTEIRPVDKLRVTFLEQPHRPFPRFRKTPPLPDFVKPPRITRVTPHDFDPSHTKPSRDPDVDSISFGDDAGRFGFCCRYFEGQNDTLQGVTVLSNCKLT
jgi:hypothetical protein